MSLKKGERSVRLLRVGENVRHALSSVFARDTIRDAELAGRAITVTAVNVSPDLRHADVFVVPLLDDMAQDMAESPVVRALARHASYIRGQLAPLVRMKYTPQLHFKLDESFGEGDRIERILRSDKVRRDLEDSDNEADSPDEDR